VQAAEPPVDLRCESLGQPLAVEGVAPRLSWRLRDARLGAAQTAWRVIVASSAAQAARGEGDLWDSGRVAGDATTQVPYAGRALPARTDAYWRVQVWDEQNAESAWSETARFRLGLAGEGDWTAQWIAAQDATPLHTRRDTLHLPPARHFRTEFAAKKPVARATLYASALGIYDAHLNGARVGDAYFQPGWADYRQRAHYRAHDVTGQIKPGANALGFVLADGWYGRLRRLRPAGRIWSRKKRPQFLRQNASPASAVGNRLHRRHPRRDRLGAGLARDVRGADPRGGSDHG
jgi:alpha-L-rhamnosidase